MPGKPKGLPKTGGRKKGTTNKVTGEVREMISEALSELGGKEYLIRQGKENPVAFLGLVGKSMPKEIKADINVRNAPGMLMVLQ